jgi:hypothetical protein
MCIEILDLEDDGIYTSREKPVEQQISKYLANSVQTEINTVKIYNERNGVLKMEWNQLPKLTE